jgi:hypothetical protein
MWDDIGCDGIWDDSGSDGTWDDLGSDGASVVSLLLGIISWF